MVRRSHSSPVEFTLDFHLIVFKAGCSNGSDAQSCNEACCVSGSVSGSVASRSRRGRRLLQQQQYQQQEQNCLLTPEMMSNKTSKEIYKDLAKQWGITCKMSESCRCMDCQSHYFDCDYDDVSWNKLNTQIYCFHNSTKTLFFIFPERTSENGWRIGSWHAHVHQRGDARIRLPDIVRDLGTVFFASEKIAEQLLNVF